MRTVDLRVLDLVDLEVSSLLHVHVGVGGVDLGGRSTLWSCGGSGYPRYGEVDLLLSRPAMPCTYM